MPKYSQVALKIKVEYERTIRRANSHSFKIDEHDKKEIMEYAIRLVLTDSISYMVMCSIRGVDLSTTAKRRQWKKLTGKNIKDKILSLVEVNRNEGETTDMWIEDETRRVLDAMFNNEKHDRIDAPSIDDMLNANIKLLKAGKVAEDENAKFQVCMRFTTQNGDDAVMVGV